MAVETTTIEGDVLDLDATPAEGELRIRLNQAGRVPDGADSHVVGGELRVTIGPAGAVSFPLIPNDVITPAGTIYVVEYVLANGRRFREGWSVATAPDPIDIGAVTRIAL